MSFNRAFHRNAQYVGSKKLGPDDLKFNVIKYNLFGRVFSEKYLDEIRNAPKVVIGYGPDNAQHANLRVSVVELSDGATLKIEQMGEMRQYYGWNDNTPLSVYHYTSGTRSARGGGGGETHNFIFIVEEEEESASKSCKGCGVNM